MQEQIYSTNAENNVGDSHVTFKTAKIVIKSRSKLRKKRSGCCGRLFAIFRFAEARQKVVFVIGAIVSIGHGCLTPISMLVLGNTVSLLQSQDTCELCNGHVLKPGNPCKGPVTTDPECVKRSNQKLADGININVMIYLGMAILMFTFSLIQNTCWSYACAKMCGTIRKRYFNSVLQQEIAWFDKQEAGKVTLQFTENISLIKRGTGVKLGLTIEKSSVFLGGFIVGFVKGPKLAAIILAMCPLLLFIGGSMAMLEKKFANKESDAYAKAGIIAQQAIANIRTVFAFAGENVEIQRYKTEVAKTRRVAALKISLAGVLHGFIFLALFCAYAVGFYYGTWLVKVGSPGYTIGVVITVFYAILAGTIALGTIPAYVGDFITATAAAKNIYATIDRQPLVADPGSDQSIVDPAKLRTRFAFKNVNFRYPTRPELQVSRNLSLNIEQGQTVALVGLSGGGKSTVVQLLQRLYDPDGGAIEMDGVDLRRFALADYRRLIGVVSQEPVLFDMTIRENIAVAADEPDNVTNEHIVNVCRQANAHDFITQLPQGYNTMITANLSGGQKQRIAIARALIRRPRLLILDEATSALDSESERVVQDALERASAKRTTVVIAHRLSTIRNADLIVVLKNGHVAEKGKHDELIRRGGDYAQLARHRSRLFTPAREPQRATEGARIVQQQPQSDKPRQTQTPQRTPRQTNARQQPSPKNRPKPGATKSARPPAGKQSRKPTTKPLSKSPGRKADPSMINMGVGGISRPAYRNMATHNSLTTLYRRSSIEMTMDIEGQDRGATKGATKRRNALIISRHYSAFRLWRLNLRELPLMLVGFLSAIVNGGVWPVMAVALVGVISTFVDHRSDASSVRDEDLFWFIMLFLGIGGVCLIGYSLQASLIGYAGEKLVERLRNLAFEALMRQDCTFFDKEENSVGALTSRLSEEIQAVRGANGVHLGNLIRIAGGMSIALAIGFKSSWRTTLIVSTIVPIVYFAGKLQQKWESSNAGEDNQIERASKIMSDVVQNIRTVVTLSLQKNFTKRFELLITQHERGVLRKSAVFGMMFGFTQAAVYVAYALMFYLGVYWQNLGIVRITDVLTALVAIMVTADTLGEVSAYLPDIGEAKLSAAKIFQLIDEPTRSELPGTDDSTNIVGNVAVQNLKFFYPTRPNQMVLNGLSLGVRRGHKLALVGPSGCGKSSIIQLLLNFYDPISGKRLIDEKEFSLWAKQHVRRAMGLVQQEPILFDRTIAENLRYGDNTRTIDDKELIAVAKQANIHSFIESQPDGYDTRVGEKGAQLSGGQKQRIAIARALVRKPKILLLDEATSALDVESEEIVQKALDIAQKGRTSIIIAHRLSTIVNVDQIVVIKAGLIVESGNHNELVRKGGLYAKLWDTQQLK